MSSLLLSWLAPWCARRPQRARDGDKSGKPPWYWKTSCILDSAEGVLVERHMGKWLWLNVTATWTVQYSSLYTAFCVSSSGPYGERKNFWSRSRRRSRASDMAGIAIERNKARLIDGYKLYCILLTVTNACVQRYGYIHNLIYTYTYMSIHRLYTWMYMHVYTRIYTYRHVYACTYVDMCFCIIVLLYFWTIELLYTYIYIYIYYICCIYYCIYAVYIVVCMLYILLYICRIYSVYIYAVYMYICIYICIYICKIVYMYTCKYVHMCICIFVYVYIYIYVCT